MVYAVEKAAEAYGYRVLLCNSDNNVEKERSAIEELLSYKVGGLVIVPVNFLTDNNLKLINDVWRGGTPVVCVDVYKRQAHHRPISRSAFRGTGSYL